MSALSDPHALCVPLSSTFVSSSSITALIDSGSTHCFVDSNFAHTHNLPLTSIPPIQLTLFDGTSNATITQSISIPVTFDSGESMTLNLFVTPFDPSCSVVLGYDWLTRYNPLIDWVLGCITFRSQAFPSPTSSAIQALLPLQNSSIPEALADLDPPKPFTVPPCVALIGAAAFALAAKQPGAQCFKIHLSDLSASVSDNPPDLSHIPEEYHDFADVFSKTNADTLAPHRPYDLKIDLEEGASPPIGPMYSLSQSKLVTLCEFIEENLWIGFIHPTTSPRGAPVLFIKKKDGSLRLCIDFRGLNRITKKDRYPLPFISDLLSTAGKARTYTTLDLRHAYHLVCIAEGDK